MTTLPKIIDAKDLEKYRGYFSFEEDLLRERVKTAHPHYDEMDPKTWPIVNSYHVRQATGKLYNGIGQLPTRVAYTAAVFSHFERENPMLFRFLRNQDHTEAWAGYPFNCYQDNWESLKDLVMNGKEYGHWISLFGDKEAGNRATQPAADLSTDANRSFSEADTAYEHIMKAVTEQNDVSAAQRELQATLTSTRTELAKKTKRTEETERQVLILKLDLDDCKEAKRDLEWEVRTLKEKLKNADNQIRDLNAQVEQHKGNLEVARQEAAESKQQIVNIWNAMQNNDRNSIDLTRPTKIKRSASALDDTTTAKAESSK